jgi:hypothetical protein
MRRRYLFAFAATAATAWSFPPALAEPPEVAALSLEKRKAYDIERLVFADAKESPRFKYATKSLPGYISKTDLTFVTEVRTLRADGKDTPPPRYVTVTRYDYRTGLTYVSTVDLQKGIIARVLAEPNRPTPVAAFEIQLAVGVINKIEAGARPASVQAVLDNAPDSKTYGHRLLVVWQEDPVRTKRYLVDLTTQKLINPNY